MNYQRILSYLYDYDRGVKRRNIGFVKIEARGDQCRVNIHMKLPEVLPPEMLHAYFFFRRNDELLGIPFADLQTAGNECGVRSILPARFFEKCGFWPEDFAGVYICQDIQKDLVFVSAWDDAPVYVETFRELRPAEKTGETEEQTLSQEEEEPGEEKEPEEEKGPAEEKMPAEKTGEIRERTPSQEEKEPGEEEGETEEKDPVEDEYAAKKFLGESLKERKPDRSEAGRPEERMSEAIEATELAESVKLTGSAELMKTECRTNSRNLWEPTEQEDLTDPGNTAEPTEPENRTNNPENTAESGERIEKNPLRSPWEELAKNFTKFRIIDGDSTVECLKIRPHHLALLPRKYWNDASGSFLLHGYYTYGHIILARREPEDACFLGIPGKNRDRERVMAAYYGYTKYLSAGEKKHGYWCRNISL